ncbi:MAG: ABC transporter ATP-binding protein [Deltaproteobacteria bacterium]|jgi:oligopeptide/dipeptide ABC transporter ATP-binding protein|nr:ABC transporter ATP-binding protein [Deltaproteobacteria bacterium]
MNAPAPPKGLAGEAPILALRSVRKYFMPSQGLASEIASLWRKKRDVAGSVQAVKGLDLEVKPGEILGLVGESGSGKSTLGRLMCRLHEPDQGQVLYEGRDLALFSKAELKGFRAKVQFMFQDPASSLNPRLTARSALTEGLTIHKLGTRAEKNLKVNLLMEEVGLSADLASRYPHQFSGGQRQRLCLARALSLDPKLLIADEPASALDVSIQAQIINLLLSLKERRGLTMVLISHDLALVCLMADRLAVMYGGLLMEVFPRSLLGKVDHHPYVKALWASIDSTSKSDLILEGEPPDPQNPPPGCPFNPRCPEAEDICREREIRMIRLEPDRSCACHRRA